MAKVDPLDLRGLKTYSIARRRNLVSLRDFGTLADGRKAADFINSLPSIYAARDLRTLVNEIERAHRAGDGLLPAMGARDLVDQGPEVPGRVDGRQQDRA